jgi:1,4-alpha-glucan branching enzyme
VELVEDFQVDGFRVDLTDAIHAGNRRVADSAPVARADEAGAAFLRQWARTLKMLRPDLWLIAEDHTGRHEVLANPDVGGLGFDGRWRSSFYHHLIGDAQPGEHWARLLDSMARDDEGPLPMRRFAEALQQVSGRDVVYHESHDEAGNSTFTAGSEVRRSKRTLQVAAAGAPLDGAHRPRAEALTRAAAGLAMLTPGAALFLMGEEVGASEEYRYDDFLWHREDLGALRRGRGRGLYAYFRDLIGLRLRSPALRQGELQVLRADDDQRVLVFVRRHEGEEVLVVLNGHPHPFPRGYRIHDLALADGTFREVLNSGLAMYGGEVGTRFFPPLEVHAGGIEPVMPGHGLLVYQRA